MPTKKEKIPSIREVAPGEFQSLCSLYDKLTRQGGLEWQKGVPADEKLPVSIQKIYKLINRALHENQSYPHTQVTTIEEWWNQGLGIVLRTSYERDGFNSFPTQPIDMWIMLDGRAFLFQPEAFKSPKITEIVIPHKA